MCYLQIILPFCLLFLFTLFCVYFCKRMERHSGTILEEKKYFSKNKQNFIKKAKKKMIFSNVVKENRGKDRKCNVRI